MSQTAPSDAPSHIAFSEDEYRARLDRVRARMQDAGLSELVVTEPENVTYLTGFVTTGYHVPQWLICPIEGEPYFVLRELERSNVAATTWLKEFAVVRDGEDSVAAVARAVTTRTSGGGPTIGYDDAGRFPTGAMLERLRELCAPARWVPSAGMVEAERVVKSPPEITYLRRGAEIADAALLAGAASVADAETDSDVAAAVYGELVRRGGEYTGSPPYVAAGPASAIAHVTHALRPIPPSSLVWIEVAGSVNRYHAMVGRATPAGAPTDELRACAALAEEALAGMEQAMRPGATSEEVDRAGRSVVERAGHADKWRHRGGYSMGISFPPGLGEGHIFDIKPGDQRELRAGMAIAVIPGVSIPGLGEIGCFETFLITEDGSERLSRVSRNLFED